MKTIIMFSAHRCGSTAMFTMFQKHPDVKIINVNQKIENWEPNYWYWGAFALDGSQHNFKRKLKESIPDIDIPHIITKKIIFDLWDEILIRFGPTIFDKSPIYLNSRAATKLLREYIKGRNKKFRFFAFIRDPRDAIVSQYHKWPGNSLERWERQWLDKYKHLEDLCKVFKCNIYRYEDVANEPGKYIPQILDDCGVQMVDGIYNHIKPVHVGRHKKDKAVKKWVFSDEFKKHLEKYSYK